MLSKEDVENESKILCSQLEFEFLRCENVSQEHHGHAAAHAHSHFKLFFRANFHHSKQRLAAHQAVMRAVTPLISSHVIHSVILIFEPQNSEPSQ